MDIFSSDTAVNPRDWSCETARHILARPDVLPLDGSPRAALLSCHALLESQVHHWYHCRSCFKVTRRTPAGKVCRMFFPKEARSRTEWTKTDTVGLRREIGCEYLNTYLPLVANVFKCNHDVKFLTAAEGPEKAYYMMKYTTKDQNTVENPLAIHLHAYDKAHLRLAECVDAVAAGRRCVQSMCCSMTNAQEVSAPLAALYLDRKSPFYSSVEFQNIHLWSCVNQVFNGTGIDVLLAPVNGGSSFQTCGPYLDYIYRPARMENIHLLSFTRLYEKRKNLLGHRFGDNHRQHRSHTVHLRAVPVGACILGKRLPNMRGPEVQPHNREAFQQAMLVLFHPFRCSEELFPFVGPDSNEKYLEWWNSGAPNDARQFLAFSNDYYASREMARERADEDIERYREYIDGASNSSSENSEDESDSGGHRGSFADDCFDEEDTAILTSDRPYTPLIKRADSAAQLAARSLVLKASHAFPYESLTSDILDRCIAHAEQSLLNRESSCPDNQVLQTNPICLPTRVHLLENAISDADAWSPPALFAAVESTVLPSGSSIQSVSRHFQLNEKQHKAFARVGKPFLKSLLSDSDVPQLIGFLGGHPGSRKSQVIRALQGLGSSWGAEDAIRTVAYQGVAAEAANGQTIHKLFKWGIKKGAHAKRYTVHDKEQFARLKLFIMDEVSTTDAKFIGMIDIALRELKNEPRRRFGGVHVLFVGDWLQQLPVAGHPAFLPQPPPPTSHRASRGGDDAATVFLLRQRGIDAYGEIYEVVILEENMRHRDDPQWRDILSRWRVGDYREEDIDLVNHHCYGRNWEADAATEKKAFCPILVTSNALRVEFNELATHQYCEATGATLHYFPASVTHAKKTLSQAQRRSLSRIRSDKSGGLPMTLVLAEGIPMQCTKNISRALHLANGTIGILAGVHHSEGDTVRVEANEAHEVHFHSKPADTLFLRLLDKPLKNAPIVSCVPAGVTPVQRTKSPGVNIAISDRSFSVSVDQVPAIPAFSLTTEKCQGLTVEKVVIAPMRHQTRRQPQRPSFYVAVTRVKSMRHLFLLEPLTLEFLAYFTPSDAALHETRRLQEAEAEYDRRHTGLLPTSH